MVYVCNFDIIEYDNYVSCIIDVLLGLIGTRKARIILPFTVLIKLQKYFFIEWTIKYEETAMYSKCDECWRRRNFFDENL